MNNRWSNPKFEIITPIGTGTIVGMAPDGTKILVMHTRPKEERSKTKGATYARWWDFDPQKGEIIANDTGRDEKNGTQDASES